MNPSSFRFVATTSTGLPMRGSIDALDADDARRQLIAAGMSNVSVDAPVEAPRVAEPVNPVGPLGADELIAFNQQIIQLSRAGLPLEHGLQLLAEDLGRGRLRDATVALQQDLAAGVPLDVAIGKHRGAFPSGYAGLIDAGLRSGRLPEVLLTVGRHLTLVERLKSELTRALSYPLVVLIAIVALAAFLTHLVLIPLRAMLVRMLGTRLPDWSSGSSRRNYDPPTVPWVTDIAIFFGHWMPWVLGVLVIGALLAWLMRPALRRSGTDVRLRDFAARLPLIGPALRDSLIARWCSVAQIGVNAGVDLPAAIEMASTAIGSPALRADGALLAGAVERGDEDSMRHRPTGLRMMPPIVPSTIVASSRVGSLNDALTVLSEDFRQQAEVRASRLPTILLPILLIVLAALVIGLIASIFLPIFSLVRPFMAY
ncbi:MAG: type II secretion system F family protein [Tepidisphaeraceae bacterium]